MKESSKWDLLYGAAKRPSWEEIGDFIANPLWNDLNDYIKKSYKVEPELSYSVCPAQRGWNVKYEKGARALCTLYPEDGFFIALVVIASREEMIIPVIFSHLTEYVREVYTNSAAMSMGRWLMIRVTDEKVLSDVKALLSVRVKPKE